MEINRVFSVLVVWAAVWAGDSVAGTRVRQEPQKPNILVIFGDDVGQANLSVYSHGVVGYKTPHLDRIAREGMMFTDYYAEQSPAKLRCY